MAHTPHDYSGYDKFEDFDAADMEAQQARGKFSALQNSRTQAWALARDYTAAGGNAHHLIDAIQAFMNGEPEPPVGPPPVDVQPDPEPEPAAAEPETSA